MVLLPIIFNTFLLAVLGGQEHCHEAAFQLGILLHGCDLSAGISKVHQQLLTQIGVSHLTAAEPDTDLNTIAVCQELLCSLDLGIKVVGTNRPSSIL